MGESASHRAARFLSRVTSWLGSYTAIISSVVIILVWLVTGPMFHFSDTWQLFINTFTTLITYLMVFVIQNTQNRDNHALHAKLDDIILRLNETDNELIGIEENPDEDIRKKQQEIRDER